MNNTDGTRDGGDAQARNGTAEVVVGVDGSSASRAALEWAAPARPPTAVWDCWSCTR